MHLKADAAAFAGALKWPSPLQSLHCRAVDGDPVVVRPERVAYFPILLAYHDTAIAHAQVVMVVVMLLVKMIFRNVVLDADDRVVFISGGAPVQIRFDLRHMPL